MMTNFGYSRTGVPPVGYGRLLSRSIHALREPQGRPGYGKPELDQRRRTDRRARFRHLLVFAAAAAILATVPVTKVVAQTAWGVDVSTTSLTVKRGELVSYRVRLTQPPDSDGWWIVIRVDGVVRYHDPYNGLRWVPSFGWDFDRSDWPQDSTRQSGPGAGPLEGRPHSGEPRRRVRSG